MRNTAGHYHAYTHYSDTTGVWQYIKLVISVVECKLRRGASLTVHLPYEIVYLSQYIKRGQRFISFGERLKRYFRINLTWENAPRLKYGSWKLTQWGNVSWLEIPKNIDITLDIGHLILGSKNDAEAMKRVREAFKNKQIRHLHLHWNDYVHDQHDIKTIPSEIIQAVEKRRGWTYIYERST